VAIWAGRFLLPRAELWDTAQQKRSPVERALRWVWNHPEVTVVLSGLNEESHIAENIAIAEPHIRILLMRTS